MPGKGEGCLAVINTVHRQFVFSETLFTVIRWVHGNIEKVYYVEVPLPVQSRLCGCSYT